jgi:hypothetical protein
MEEGQKPGRRFLWGGSLTARGLGLQGMQWFSQEYGVLVLLHKMRMHMPYGQSGG